MLQKQSGKPFTIPVIGFASLPERTLSRLLKRADGHGGKGGSVDSRSFCRDTFLSTSCW